MKNPLSEVRRIDLRQMASSGELPPEAIAAKQLNEKKVANQQKKTAEQPPLIDQEMLKEMVAQTVKTAIADLETKHAEQLQAVEEKHAAEQTELQKKHQAELDALKSEKDSTAEQLAKMQATHEASLEALKQQARTELQAVKDSLANAVAERDEQLEKAQDVFKMQGKLYPGAKGVNFNTVTTTDSDKPSGALKEYLEEMWRAPSATRSSKLAGGARIQIFDVRGLRPFMRENMKHLIPEMEKWGKNNGMFRANKSTTTGVGIPDGFLPVLSAMLRENNRSSLVFHQFVDVVMNFEKGRGDNIEVPRVPYLDPISDPDDRLLSGNGAYYDIDPGAQSMASGSVDVQLQEWGLGKNSQNQPIGLAAFTEAYSMIDLMGVLQKNLLRDYYAWEDFKIRSLLTPSSRVVYNDNNAVTTTVGDVGSGDDGTASYTFLASLEAYAKDLQIPTMPDGCYILVLPSRSVGALRVSLSGSGVFAAPTPQDVRDLMAMLNPQEAIANPEARASGYIGKLGGLHIFETNNYGVGAGAGVNTSAFGAGNTTTREGFLIGASSIGRGIGSQMEVVPSGVVPFGRAERFIWRSEEGFAALDVDPTGYNDTSAVPQQLRVIKVRTSDVAV